MSAALSFSRGGTFGDLQSGKGGDQVKVRAAHGGFSVSPAPFWMCEASRRGGGMSAPKFGMFSADPGRVSAFLRAAHPVKAPERVAEITQGRVSAEQVRKWLAGAAAPSFAATLALIAAYGPAFLAACLPHPPEWLLAAARHERRRALEQEQQRIAAELARMEDDDE